MLIFGSSWKDIVYMSIKIHLNDAQGPNDTRTTFCYTFLIKHLIIYFCLSSGTYLKYGQVPGSK